jgi:hypothetical protein
MLLVVGGTTKEQRPLPLEMARSPVSRSISVDSDLARALEVEEWDERSDEPGAQESAGDAAGAGGSRQQAQAAEGDPGAQPDDYDADLQEALAAADAYDSTEEEQPNKRRRVDGPSSSSPTPAKALSCPPHPIFVHGMCAVCGAARPHEEQDPEAAYEQLHSQQQQQQRRRRPGRGVGGGGGSVDGSVTLKHLARHQIELGAGEAQRIAKAAAARLLAARKLVLILDLDHTLLNSTRWGGGWGGGQMPLASVPTELAAGAAEEQCRPQELALLERPSRQAPAADPPPSPPPPPSLPPRPLLPACQRVSDNVVQQHTQQIAAAFEAQAVAGGRQRQQLFHTGLGSLYTKMRPGVFPLLELLREAFELHIYTMGDRCAGAGAAWRGRGGLGGPGCWAAGPRVCGQTLRRRPPRLVVPWPRP